MTEAQITEAQITSYLGTNSGKILSQIYATGAIIFNPSDYCPYTEECLSFKSFAKGDNGRKGVESHLRKVHADVVIYLVPFSLRDFMEYAKKHPDKVENITKGIIEGRLNFCPVVSSQQEASKMEKKLRRLFAEKRYTDHYKTFLDPAITSKSRDINSQDIQAALDALTDNWARSPVSEIGTSGKADATRARMHAISRAVLANAYEGENRFETIAGQIPALRNP